MTICIVEPDEEMRTCVRKAFVDAGFTETEVAAFENAQEALVFLAGSTTVRAIVTNVGRVGEGPDFVSRLRQLPEHRYTPIYYHTRHTRESFKEATGIRVDDLGGNEAYLRKNGELAQELVRLVMSRA